MNIDLTDSRHVPWMALLNEALNAPGTLSKAYETFYQYSLGNMLLAWVQTLPDKLGPIATYKRWNALGRQVRKGEKAIALYMPITIKQKDNETDEVIGSRTGFMMKRNWFSLAQTDGEQIPQFEPPPEWSVERALSALHITQIPFCLMDGNTLGATLIDQRQVMVSPLCKTPLRTLFHELAHVDLHADGDPLSPHGERPPMDIREVEAETVSYLVADTLGVEMDKAESRRGYIQHWMADPEARADFAKGRASRVFGCAQRIIAAGKSTFDKHVEA